MTTHKLFSFSIILMTILFITGNLFAMPPHPKKVLDEIQRGTLPQLEARLQAMSTRSMDTENRSFPKTGTNHVLVLLIDFKDIGMDTQSTTTFYEELFEGGGSTTLTWKKYYQDMSDGQLILTFDVHKCSLPASQTLSYYGANSGGPGTDMYPATLVGEAVNQGDNDGIDFSLYDNDNDNYCDAVIIIHADQGEEFYTAPSTAIWSHRWNLQSAKSLNNDGPGAITVDGVIVNDYAIQPEYISSVGDSTVGVFVHEFGHILGLADIYDTSLTNAGGPLTDGVGKWSLMAAGSWNGPNGYGSVPAPLLAWERGLLNWVNIDSRSPYYVQNDTPAPYLSIALLFVLFFGCGGSAFIVYKKRNLRHLVPFLLTILFIPGVLITFSTCDLPNEPVEVQLQDIDTSYRAIKIDSGYSYTGSYSSSGGDQYYLCENKVQKTGTWSEYLPGEGLLITLVDNYIIYNIPYYSTSYLGTYIYNGINALCVDENTPWCHGVTIIEADGDDDLWVWTSSNNDKGSSTDPFYNRSSVNLYRNHYSGDLTGAELAVLSDVTLSDISSAGGTITFTYEN